MALEDDINLLKQAPVFCHLEPDALRLLAFAAESLNLETGEVLFSYNDYSDGGYIIRSGEIIIQSPLDQESLIAGPRSLIGQTALFTRIHRPATATARSPANLIRVSTNLMKRCLSEYPSGAHIIHSALAENLQELTRNMLQIHHNYLEN